MFSAFNTFGKLGALASSVARAWSPLALWPDGIATPGMWISPRDLTSQWADYTGTTPVATPGTVADSSNPVGLALDIRAGATVLTDPGLHMLQSTSAARPLLSARVNLLTKTEDFADAVWFPSSTGTYTVEANTEIAPDGSMTASRYTAGPTGNPWMCQVYSVPLTGVFCVYARVISGNPSFGIRFNGGTGEEHVTLTDTWTRVEVNGISAGYCQYTMVVSPSSVLALWHPQLNLGPTALPYQRVTSASDYDSTGFPIAQLYDGTDDGMATAAFAAGTLIDGMDCLIPVRRDSAAACIAGLYNGIADATKFFGMAESASGSGCVGSGAGTPTVWVDNTQLTGGTAVTGGTLHTALTVGDWHILEFRNLDLSTWTAAGFGLYTSYLFPGPRGDILLFPSTASTEDKDAARQWLADYYGVTLP